MTSEERDHQVDIRRYIFSDAVHQHLYNVETGRITSSYQQNYFEKIKTMEGFQQLQRVGLGPMLSNQTDVRYCVSVSTDNSANHVGSVVYAVIVQSDADAE